ncbi:MAG TPA: 30S ribosomal protein S18 [Actinomycetota bacterium]|jgi:small subunit ribosomal protein S18|nr:30S ribosomal protein S18 [Actinomycetota bacterium]
MPRDRGSKDRKERGDRKGGPLRRGRPKVCYFCKEKVAYIDYKDTALLRRFVSDRGKIRARRVTGSCARHQRDIALAVKNAREMALMPYTVR